MSEQEKAQGRDDRRERPAWTNCKEFKASVGQLELCVRVSRSGDYVPKYNITAGRRRQDGTVGMSIPIYARGRGKIEIARVGEVLAKLVKEAEDWIHNETQYHEDQLIEDKVRREQKGMKRDDKPKGLGALGKMDAAKRQAAAPPPAPPDAKPAEAIPTPAETK
jgi:hypothetical protein